MRDAHPLRLLVRAGLWTAVIDGGFASVLHVTAFGSTFTRLWQGVASVPLGQRAFEGGWATVTLGLALHVVVAFVWSAVFVLLALRWEWVRRRVASVRGIVEVAAVYGPFIWLVMSMVVIPIVAQHPPRVNGRFWIQLVGHIPFVAIPIVAASAGAPARRTAMGEKRWTEVDAYFESLLLPPDAVLDAALRSSHAAGLPAISVTPGQGKFLALLARARGARTILELGTLGGYSTIWLARALPEGGRLVTLESEPKHAEVARRNLARAGLERVVDLRVGRALDTLPRLAEEGQGPFDFVFIDADKETYAEYFDWALRLSRRGTLIVADNVVRDGDVVDAQSGDSRVRGIRRFNERVAREPRVSATAIQTVGGKGYDGFVIALVS